MAHRTITTKGSTTNSVLGAFSTLSPSTVICE